RHTISKRDFRRVLFRSLALVFRYFHYKSHNNRSLVLNVAYQAQRNYQPSALHKLLLQFPTKYSFLSTFHRSFSLSIRKLYICKESGCTLLSLLIKWVIVFLFADFAAIIISVCANSLTVSATGNCRPGSM